MTLDNDGHGAVERGQQQLKNNIAESNRLIDEAQQRVDSSRAITGDGGNYGQGESD
ncbi:hypothetical protein ACFSCW_11710 [Sphingomonas tabacisoli]|uniref:Uncharacterized protein n=1 Tax=Sphingomonas tabacisoli TaxID=2249466 RepID=A0ABW4I5H3_9SPHN